MDTDDSDNDDNNNNNDMDVDMDVDDTDDVAPLPHHQCPPPTLMTMTAAPPLSLQTRAGGVLDLFYYSYLPPLAPNASRGEVLVIFLIVLLIHIIIYKLMYICTVATGWNQS